MIAAQSLADYDIPVTNGRIRLRRWGRPEDPLALCVHGLTANLTAFSWLAEALVRRGLQVAAIDARGRGNSEITAPGTYGLRSHADDVVELIDQLGGPVDLIGWSMGALVCILVAADEPSKVRHLVLIDHVGPMTEDAIAQVSAATARLDARVPQPEDFIDAIRSRQVIDPWTPFWTDHYTYELARTNAGDWTPTTSREACLEDLADAAELDWTREWAALTVPTTVIRCLEKVGGALLIAEQAKNDFSSAVPNAQLVEVPTNHYTVLTDPTAAETIATRLRR